MAAILGHDRNLASEIRSIVGTPVADDGVVVEYFEEPTTPTSLAEKIEKKLSRHNIVKVKLDDDNEMKIEKGAIFTHFLVSPFELVGARGVCLPSFKPGRAALTAIECDNIVEKGMSFEEFMDDYERDKLSMSAHTNPRDDLPLFLRFAACAFIYIFTPDSSADISTTAIGLDGARIFQELEAPWIAGTKRT